MRINVGVLLFLLARFHPAKSESLRSRAIIDEIESRIFKGTAADPGEFPAFASLCSNNSTSCYECGGFLATESHVVTAGHCILQLVSVTGVRVGNTVSRTDGEYRDVKKVVVHPDFIRETSPRFKLVNDVAVLTLESPVTGVTPYAYNRDSAYSATAGTNLTVIGFGKYQAGADGLPNSEYLRKTTVLSQTDGYCESVVNGSSSGPFYDYDAMMCTYASLTGTCAGDSGGPALDENDLVLGLMSWGATDCSDDTPDYQTDLWNYADWIDQQIAPTAAPSAMPSLSPSLGPTPNPTRAPTKAPTKAPTLSPTTAAPDGSSCGGCWATIRRWMGFADGNISY